jgi:Ser/Thr protein kinase RdoA (MazF antagonist)
VAAGRDALVGAVAAMEAQMASLAAQGTLPEQLIHADLHFDNVLVEGGNVTGLLDFEFAARDWRACEVAVGLSKYIALPDIEPVFVEWVDGFVAGGGRLTLEEVELVPDLIV